jgi:hypothetical protein
MNNKVKSEKFRKLSITSLVTGILAIVWTKEWGKIITRLNFPN